MKMGSKGLLLSLLLLLLLLFSLSYFVLSGREASAAPASRWLDEIFGNATVTETWTTWIYRDPVTRRRILLPSQPHLLTAEPHVVQLFDQHLICSSGGHELFVDVGMNSGFYSLVAQVRGCRVLAVEMQSSCVSMFRFAQRANMLSQDNVEVMQRAVTFRDGDRFVIDDTRRCEGMLSLFWEGTREIRSITLDTLLPPARGHVSMLKIDIEGFEPYALAGAVRLITEQRVALIIMEATWWPNVFQPVAHAYQRIGFVFDHGYSIRCLGGSKALLFTTKISWLKYGSSHTASQLLAGDPEGRRVSPCTEFAIWLRSK